MAEAIKHLGLSAWYEDDKDEIWDRAEHEPQNRRVFVSRSRKEASGPEQQLAPLLRVAWMVAEREDLTEQVNALAKKLEVGVEWVYQMALVEFLETHGIDTKGHADTLRRASPFWQIHRYTTEEMDALLKEDTFSPEMAERYKDLLED